MSREKEFQHESLQDRRSIIRYLEALTEGFSAGILKFSDRDGEILLEPNGLVTIEVRASRSRNQVRLKLNFSWKDGPSEDSGKAPLLINGHHE